MPGTKLQEHSGNDKSWVWSTVDFAEEEQKPELFCIRFASVEREPITPPPPPPAPPRAGSTQNAEQIVIQEMNDECCQAQSIVPCVEIPQNLRDMEVWFLMEHRLWQQNHW